MLTTAPVLHSDRLVLRGHRLTDFEACVSMWSDPEVCRHIGGRPSSRTETWTRLLRYVGHWSLLGFGYWAITEKTSGTFLGEAGLANYQRELSPSLDGIPESGWALISSAHGQGLATEAVRTILRWADVYLERSTTACLINPHNKASIRLAEKVGYTYWRKTQLAGQPTSLFRRLSNTGD